jgi:hypothetical protein
MKEKLKLMMLLFGVSTIILIGCKKHDKEDGIATTITGTNLAVLKQGIITGTFTATGGINTSGTHIMVVQPVGSDSIHCTWTMTAPEGNFTMIQDCSLINMTGSWHINSGTGTGRYAGLRGNGSLTMNFPPNPIVPPGALGVEINTGVVWLNP